MANKKKFERFTDAIRDLDLDPKKVKGVSHSSAVTDFSNWDQIRNELEKGKEQPRKRD
ncbi:MAG: hypothetical protein OXU23_28230 [Candidatus Poribacteria bacterium]|nr:hypothetical protein [Candidatus Poribacteria bacterium]